MNTLRDVAPNPAPAGSQGAIVTAWTGGCVDQDRGELILAANGGHLDYAGNEVYSCMLKRETPVWVRLSNPSSNTGGSDSYNDLAQYPDGNPRSVHGWSHCVWANGKVWHLGMMGMYPNGYWSTAVWSFDRNSLSDGPFPVSAASAPWTYHGKGIQEVISPGSNTDWQSGSSAYDPIRRRLWTHCVTTVNFPPYPFFSVDAVSGEITRYPDVRDTFAQGEELADAMSVIVDGIWIIVAPKLQKLYLLDTARPNNGFRSVSTSGSPTGFTHGAGAVYHAASRAILVYDPSYGTALRKLSIPVDLLGGRYVWSRVEAAGSSATPGGQASDFQGVFSKFNIIQDMGNGQSALAMVLDVGGPVYVYKLPADGV